MLIVALTASSPIQRGCERQRACRFTAKIWLRRLRTLLPAPAIAMLIGCGSLQPCDQRDLESKYGLFCGLRGVRAQPQRDEQQGFLAGNVSSESAASPIVILAYRSRAHGVEIASAAVLSHPGEYELAVPAGVYRLAAFEDGNGDFRYDPTRERAALYHDGGSVPVKPGERVDRLYIKLRNERPQRLELELSLPAGFAQVCCSTPADHGIRLMGTLQ